VSQAATPAAPLTEAVATATANAIPQGRTAEGYHVLGRDDAPVTMQFYSDFF
jgi:hypothetical protein